MSDDKRVSGGVSATPTSWLSACSRGDVSCTKLALSLVSPQHSKNKELYDTLMDELTQLEAQHAKIPRPHVEPDGAFYNALIGVYTNIEKKCVAFLSELLKSEEANLTTDQMIDDVLKRLEVDLTKTEIAFRGRQTQWGQPSYDGTRSKSYLHNQYQFVSSQLYPIFLKYYLKRFAFNIPSVAMSKQLAAFDPHTIGTEISQNPSFSNVQRLAERAAFVEITKKRHQEVARINRELQQKYGGKYVAYVNENPQAQSHEYYYHEPGRSISTFDRPEITEQRIQHEQDELKAHLDSLLRTAVEKSGTFTTSSYYLMIDVRYSGEFVGGFGYRIILPFTQRTYPTTFSHIIRIMKENYGESFVQPTFKNKKATRPIFFVNNVRFKGYDATYTFNPGDLIEMKYPLFEKWQPQEVLSKGGKRKKRRTYKIVKTHKKRFHKSSKRIKQT